MSAKKQKPIILSELTKEEMMKYEIAQELGLRLYRKYRLPECRAF